MTKLLITATMNRADLVRLFAPLRDHAELLFVDYDDHWGTPIDPVIYAPYGSVSTWREHRSAQALLDTVNPDRIVMLAINSREQVALRLAARERGIEVIHLEHGYRLPLGDRDQLLPRSARPKPTPGLPRHYFFLRSLALLRLAHRRRLVRYAGTSLRGLGEVQWRNFADIRRPDRYVSFSPECFAYHRDLDLVPPEIAETTQYIGVPTFDCFTDQTAKIDPDAIVLIDHQLHNSGMRGWTADYHRSWAEQVYQEVCVARGQHLYVKEHPGDLSDSWAPFFGHGVTRVHSIDELAALLRSSRVVLGGATTLQIPAAALAHTVLIALEIHPQPGLELSRRFIEAGIAEPVRSFTELRDALSRTESIHEQQAPNKAAFTDQFLYRIDGRSGERLVSALAGAGAASREPALER